MTRIEDLDEEEIERRAGEEAYVEAMRYVEGARFFPPGDAGAGSGAPPSSAT